MPTCRLVRSVLLAIAALVPRELASSRTSLSYDIDPHSSSILRLPALGNRSAVSVSIYAPWNRSIGSAFETDLDEQNQNVAK
jgi:hypothetical protein